MILMIMKTSLSQWGRIMPRIMGRSRSDVFVMCRVMVIVTILWRSSENFLLNGIQMSMEGRSKKTMDAWFENEYICGMRNDICSYFFS